MQYSQSVHDTLFDTLLSMFGYVPALHSFGIFDDVEKTGKSEIVENLFDAGKEFELCDGFVWGDFAPEGNPITNRRGWNSAAAAFLRDPDGYIVDLPTVIEGEWQDANAGNAERLVELQLWATAELNICSTYDNVWPQIVANYRLMSIGNPSKDQDAIKRFSRFVAIGRKIGVPQPHADFSPTME